MAVKKMKRLFFTWNNWQKDFETKEKVKEYFDNFPYIKFYVIGFEIGEQGTEHLQGVIGLTQQTTFNYLRELLKNNHIEKIIDLKSAVTYCKKGNDYIEFGDVVDQGERTDIVDFKNAIVSGLSDLELLEEYPSQWFKYSNHIDTIRALTLNDYYSKNNREHIRVIYLGGVSGSGKTSFVYRNFDVSNVYRVTNYDNPFDLYKGQKILVLDEFRESLKLPLLLNVLDIYPMLLPARYNDKWACFDTVFIMSNWEYKTQYNWLLEHEPLSMKALDRRIHLKLWLSDSDVDREYCYTKMLDLMMERDKLLELSESEKQKKSLNDDALPF